MDYDEPLLGGLVESRRILIVSIRSIEAIADRGATDQRLGASRYPGTFGGVT